MTVQIFFRFFSDALFLAEKLVGEWRTFFGCYSSDTDGYLQLAGAAWLAFSGFVGAVTMGWSIWQISKGVMRCDKEYVAAGRCG